jgi:hypothetical protein
MAVKAIKQTFGTQSYPSEMRRQLWALCCGASIISGFKEVNQLTDEELVADIKKCLATVPDMQVFGGETINPKFTFLTLNSGQMGSKKIMSAIEKCGFFRIGTGNPRGGEQGFFLRDGTVGTWKPTMNTKNQILVDIYGQPLKQAAVA